MTLHENILIQTQKESYGSLFYKVDIYNARKQCINENISGDILLTNDERQAIKSMIHLIQAHIIQESLGYDVLNEGFLDDIKNGVSKVADKIKQLPQKMKNAYSFCEEMLKKSFSRISEFIKFITELFAKLGDTLREAIMSLGGFGKESITESKEDDFGNVVKSEEEKIFLQCVTEYVEKRKGYSVYLNEGALDKFHDLVSKNKFLELIVCGNYKGEKLSWWKSILVSIVGSVVINLGIGVLCAVCGLTAATTSTITGIVLCLWSGRGILRIIMNRKDNMIKNNETKFFNKAVVIQLLLTVAVRGFFMIPAVKEFIGDLINAGIDKVKQLTEDGVNNVINTITETPDPSVDDVQEAISHELGIASSAEQLADTAKETMQGVRAFDWVAGNSLLQKVQDGIIPLMPTNHNVAVDIDYHGGTPLFLADNKEIFGPIFQKYGAKISDYVMNRGIFSGKVDLSSSINGRLTQACDVAFDDDNMINLFKEIDKVAEDLGVPFHWTDLGAGETMNAISPLPEVTDIIRPEETSLDFMKYFAGFSFVPKFQNECMNKFMLSFGSENTRKKYMVVTETKEMTMEDLSKVMAETGKYANELAFQLLKVRNASSLLYVKNLMELVIKSEGKAEDTPQDVRIKEELKKQLDKISDNSKDKCLVFFTEYKNKNGQTVKLPLVAMNYRTLYAIDLIDSKAVGTRSEPYFFKGIFNHLTFKPVSEDDIETKKQIKEMLTKVLVGSVTGVAKMCQTTIGKTKQNLKGLKKDVWVLTDKSGNNKQRPELGMFTNEEIVDILNNPADSYKYFGGKFKNNIKSIDDNGNVTKVSKPQRENVELQLTYVKARILPVISCKQTDVYKELVGNKLVKKCFMDKNGEWKTIGEDKTNILLNKNIVSSLLRSPETFAKETNITFEDYIRKIFGGVNNIESKEYAHALQLISEIIWKYRHDLSTWTKQVDIYNESGKKKIDVAKNDTQEIRVSEEIKNKAKEIKKELAQNDKEVQKANEDAETWYKETILSKIYEGTPIYNDIKNDTILSKWLLYGSGKFKKSSINNKYLRNMLYMQKDNRKIDITQADWKNVAKMIKRTTHKKNDIVNAYVIKIKKFFELIAKYYSKDKNSKWQRTESKDINESIGFDD